MSIAPICYYYYYECGINPPLRWIKKDRKSRCWSRLPSRGNYAVFKICRSIHTQSHPNWFSGLRVKINNRKTELINNNAIINNKDCLNLNINTNPPSLFLLNICPYLVSNSLNDLEFSTHPKLRLPVVSCSFYPNLLYIYLYTKYLFITLPVGSTIAT